MMKENEANKKLLTENEVSKMINFSQRTLANWRKQKRGPSWICIENRSIRYPKDDLEVWLSTQKAKK